MSSSNKNTLPPLATNPSTHGSIRRRASVTGLPPTPARTRKSPRLSLFDTPVALRPDSAGRRSATPHARILQGASPVPCRFTSPRRKSPGILSKLVKMERNLERTAKFDKDMERKKRDLSKRIFADPESAFSSDQWEQRGLVLRKFKPSLDLEKILSIESEERDATGPAASHKAFAVCQADDMANAVGFLVVTLMRIAGDTCLSIEHISVVTTHSGSWYNVVPILLEAARQMAGQARIEMWVRATDDARKYYEHFGFIEYVDFTMGTAMGSDGPEFTLLTRMFRPAETGLVNIPKPNLRGAPVDPIVCDVMSGMLNSLTISGGQYDSESEGDIVFPAPCFEGLGTGINIELLDHSMVSVPKNFDQVRYALEGAPPSVQVEVLGNGMRVTYGAKQFFVALADIHQKFSDRPRTIDQLLKLKHVNTGNLFGKLKPLGKTVVRAFAARLDIHVPALLKSGKVVSFVATRIPAAAAGIPIVSRMANLRRQMMGTQNYGRDGAATNCLGLPTQKTDGLR
eukprot:766530_1